MRNDIYNQLAYIINNHTFTPEQWEHFRTLQFKMGEDGVQGRHISKQTEENIEKLISLGYSPTAIAKAANVSRQTVYRHINKIKQQEEEKLKQSETKTVDLLEIFPQIKDNLEQTDLPF